MIKLTQKQVLAIQQFFTSTKRYFLIVGGRNSGKTFVSSYITYLISRTIPASILIARETQRETENTMLQNLKRFFTPQELEYFSKTLNVKNNRFYMPSGACIYFFSANKKEEHFQKVRSYEYNFVWIDEASQIDFEAFEEIDWQVRLIKPNFRKILLTSNPVDETHWLYQFFEKEKKGEYIRFSTFDNAENLAPDYIEMIRSKPQKLQQIMVDGYWGEYKESKIYYFTEKNIIPYEIVLRDFPPFEYAQQNRIYASIDFGIKNTAIVFALRTFTDNIIIFEEFFFKDKPLLQIIDEVERTMYQKYKINIKKAKWCGDIAGKQRNLQGVSAFSLLPFPVLAEKIDINASIEKENLALTKERNKMPILLIASNCILSKKSFFEAYFTEEDKLIKEDPYEHIKDAIRYLVWHFCPLDPPPHISLINLKSKKINLPNLKRNPKLLH